MSWKDLFSFSKSELRGIAVLLILIISVAAYRCSLLSGQEKKLIEGTNKFEKEIKTFEAQLDSVSKKAKQKKTYHKPLSSTEKASEKASEKAFKPKKSVVVPVKKKEKKVFLKININTASAEELKKLKGIGDKLSLRIVKYRDKLGGFYSVGQIKEVYGIKPETFQQIKPHIYCKGAVKKININSASFKELVRHPYLTYKDVKAIFKFRDKNIPLTQEKLVEILGNEKAEKLLHYVDF